MTWTRFKNNPRLQAVSTSYRELNLQPSKYWNGILHLKSIQKGQQNKQFLRPRELYSQSEFTKQKADNKFGFLQTLALILSYLSLA